MSTLKTVIIQYRGAGVSQSAYDQFPTAEKTNYHNFLSSLYTEATFGNAHWKLSYEIYIPAGITLKIAKM